MASVNLSKVLYKFIIGTDMIAVVLVSTSSAAVWSRLRPIFWDIWLPISTLLIAMIMFLDWKTKGRPLTSG